MPQHSSHLLIGRHQFYAAARTLHLYSCSRSENYTCLTGDLHSIHGRRLVRRKPQKIHRRGQSSRQEQCSGDDGYHSDGQMPRTTGPYFDEVFSSNSRMRVRFRLISLRTESTAPSPAKSNWSNEVVGTPAETGESSTA